MNTPLVTEDTRTRSSRMSLAHRLECALELLDPMQRARLEEAETSIALRVAGDDAVTLLLDRHGPRVGRVEATEVHIEVDNGVFVSGAAPLACLIMRGEARAWGPVRKYLAVDPILRKALAEICRDDGA